MKGITRMILNIIVVSVITVIVIENFPEKMVLGMILALILYIMSRYDMANEDGWK